MSEENEVQDQDNSLDDPENENSVYVGVDPNYTNAAYPVTEPAPLEVDENKQLVADHMAAMVVVPAEGDYQAFVAARSASLSGEAAADQAAADQAAADQAAADQAAADQAAADQAAADQAAADQAAADQAAGFSFREE